MNCLESAANWLSQRCVSFVFVKSAHTTQSLCVCVSPSLLYAHIFTQARTHTYTHTDAHTQCIIWSIKGNTFPPKKKCNLPNCFCFLDFIGINVSLAWCHILKKSFNDLKLHPFNWHSNGSGPLKKNLTPGMANFVNPQWATIFHRCYRGDTRCMSKAI